MSARVIHLLRHGPVPRQGLLLGHLAEPALQPDCPLMRDRVRHLAIERVVTSDLTRAAGQAERLAHDLGAPLTIDPRWRELDFGTWEGQSPDSLDPAALGRFWDDPDHHAPPGGERWSDLRDRVAAALEAVHDRSLVVAHAGAMRAALSVITGLDHRGVWTLDLPYRALLSLRIWPGSPLSGQVIGLLTEAAP
jgi:alpha-ribazole phosphatase